MGIGKSGDRKKGKDPQHQFMRGAPAAKITRKSRVRAIEPLGVKDEEATAARAKMTPSPTWRSEKEKKKKERP